MLTSGAGVLARISTPLHRTFTMDDKLNKSRKRKAPDEEVSPYFDDVPSLVLASGQRLNVSLGEMRFSPPVKCVYNPTEYASETYGQYVRKYGSTPKPVLFLGMNPGPWGMSQTGVPFGEIDAVKNWLRIAGRVGKPPVEDPNRPVLGFDCRRSEVSGKRFWALAEHLCGTAENFFQYSYVHNYCPLQFIGPNGRNVTPDDLKVQERELLMQICDENLLEIIKIFKCEIVIGIGKFAETRVNKVFKAKNIKDIEVYSIPHPSPRAANNTDWQGKTLKVLENLKLLRFFKK